MSNGKEIREELREFFTRNILQNSLKVSDSANRYFWTGNRIIKFCKDKSVLDVGCGTNQFKGKIEDLYGIDIIDLGADEIVAIEDFETERKYDIALCFGSIQYGDKNLIDKQIEKVSKALKDDSVIFWRCSVEQRVEYEQYLSEDQKCPVPMYNWTLEKALHFAKKYEFKIVEFMPDNLNFNQYIIERLYMKWVRNV